MSVVFTHRDERMSQAIQKSISNIVEIDYDYSLENGPKFASYYENEP